MKRKLFASVSVTFLTTALLFLGGNFALFIDLQSALYVFLVGVIFFIASPIDRFAAFGNGCVNAGWIAFLVGLIYIFWGLNDVEVELIGPSFSVNFLAPLYGYFFKIVTLPFTLSELKDD